MEELVLSNDFLIVFNKKLESVKSEKKEDNSHHCTH